MNAMLEVDKDNGTPSSPSKNTRTTTSTPSWSTSRILTLLAFPIILALTIAFYTRPSPLQPQSPNPAGFTLAQIPISAVLRQNLRLATHSWEHGVLVHALLELQNPELTVFAGPGYGVHLVDPNPGMELVPFPDGKLPMCSAGGMGRYDDWANVKGLRYAVGKVVTTEPREPRGRGVDLGDGEGERGWEKRWWLYREEGWDVGDQSAADAASLGWAVLLLERADAEDLRTPVPAGSGRNVYGEAADEMIKYLVKGKEKGGNVRFVVEKEEEEGKEGAEVLQMRAVGSSDGARWAISHRTDLPQLWGDFVFMVPPYLAAYAVARGNEKWLFEAVEQILAYRDVLRVGEGKLEGLWKHIVTQPRELGRAACCHDEDIWLTSNAWALAGSVRVLGVLNTWQPKANSRFRNSGSEDEALRQRYRKGLLVTIREMLQALARSSGENSTSVLLGNYITEPAIGYIEGGKEFPDPAGSALVASSIYRLASMGLLEDQGQLRWADELYNAVAAHIRKDGVVGPVATVSEVPSNSQAESTSEAQSFVILMFAARRDCQRAGVCEVYGGPPGWLNWIRW